MSDELRIWPSWTYPAPGVTQGEAAMILGAPLAEALTEREPAIYVSWLIEGPQGALYTTVEVDE
jgi:hypothetical protein